MTTANILVVILLRPCFHPCRQHHLGKIVNVHEHSRAKQKRNTDNLEVVCSSACAACGPSSPNLTEKRTKKSSQGSTCTSQGADLLLLAAMPIVHKVSGMVSLKIAPGTNPRSLIAPGGRCAVQVTWAAATSATPMSTQASERLGYILVAYLWLRMARILVFGGVCVACKGSWCSCYCSLNDSRYTCFKT